MLPGHKIILGSLLGLYFACVSVKVFLPFVYVANCDNEFIAEDGYKFKTIVDVCNA
jgi:hypothetical protein